MHTHSTLDHHGARAAMLAMVLALVPAHDSHAANERIAIYDSRAVAYAYFWSEAGREKRDGLVAGVASAKTEVDDARLKRAETAIRDFDSATHLAVFSTGPADEALAALKDRLPAVLDESNATRLVSRWDAATLAGTDGAERIDVTARLVAEFNLPPAKLRVIDELLKQQPLPLERARKLHEAGKL